MDNEPLEVDDYADLIDALALAQAAIEQPKKSRTVTVQTDKGPYSYSYAELNDVVAAVLPELTKRGIAVTQDAMTSLEAGTVSIVTTLRRRKASITSGVLVLPIGRRDVQGVGSAITYGRRYQLATMLGIAAEAEDDGQAARGSQEAVPGAQSDAKPPKAPRAITARRLEQIAQMAARKGVTAQEVLDWAGRHGFETTEAIDTQAANELVRFLNELPDTDDATSTIGAGGTTAAEVVGEHPDDAADAESAGVGSGAVDGGSGDAGAPASLEDGAAS